VDVGAVDVGAVDVDAVDVDAVDVDPWWGWGALLVVHSLMEAET
jgi:hypothetical protein